MQPSAVRCAWWPPAHPRLAKHAAFDAAQISRWLETAGSRLPCRRVQVWMLELRIGEECGPRKACVTGRLLSHHHTSATAPGLATPARRGCEGRTGRMTSAAYYLANWWDWREIVSHACVCPAGQWADSGKRARWDRFGYGEPCSSIVARVGYGPCHSQVLGPFSSPDGPLATTTAIA
jgi:hypothetical protein